MYNLSLDAGDMNFKRIEQKLYKYFCDLGCKVFEQLLNELDDKIMAERDKKDFRNKTSKHTCIKTIMGPVEFDRRVYEYRDEYGKKSYRYLLDEYLEMETIGHMSSNLIEQMVETVTNVSMRKAANNVTKMTNQDISHTSVWNIVQELGHRIKKQEDANIEKHNNGELNGQREVEVLFEEADGIWLNMQGKDRPRNGHKREMKLSVTYEGWIKKPAKGETYILKNKRVNAGFSDSHHFKALRDAKIAQEYNVDAIKYKIINGDGASWIKEGIEEEGVYYQLDPFHKSQAVIRNVPDKQKARKIINKLHNGQEIEAMECIQELIYECGGEEEPVKKLLKLLEYFNQNKDGLRPFHLRDDLDLPQAPDGLCYRHMGTAEHHICDVLAQRMKGRKMSWSENGGNNMSKILSVKFSGKLYDMIDALLCGVIEDKKFEEIKSAIEKVVERQSLPGTKKNVYKTHRASLPLEGYAVTEGRKAIRMIFDY
jgi:hypothetical protein